MDLEKFFDRVNHDLLLHKIKERISDQRITELITRFLEKKLRLSVNQSKSAVDHPWNRSFLGFTFSRRFRRKVSEKAINRFKAEIRALTGRTRGCTIHRIIGELR